MLKIIQCKLFQKFPEIIFGFSTKIGLNRTEPYSFNMSFTVGDNKNIVEQNRKEFFNYLGLNSANIAYQKQIHSDIIKIVSHPGYVGQGDAMITALPDIGLVISSADCVPIFIYDSKYHVISAVHAGWQGTYKQILNKTLYIMFKNFNSKPEDLFAFIGPSISQKNYEVQNDVASLFEKKRL